MNTTTIAFFNNKGGVGKTSLVYHLAWMYCNLGYRVVAVDLDPQANLTAGFIDEERLEELWPDGNHPNTVFGCVQPLIRAIGDIAEPHLEYVDNQQSLLLSKLALLVGDLSLSGFEDQLSEVWPKCMDGDERAFRVISAFWRMMQKTALVHKADVILMDLGPNLGAINRAALIAADYVVVPLSPDLFSLQGLRNLGPTLRRWRKNWKDRLPRNPADDVLLPKGRMQPVGYVVLQHSVRLDRPVKAYNRWIARIPKVYRDAVLNEPGDDNTSVENDPNCLALLKNYQSLMPMAQEVRKPMFYLKPADGAIGAHTKAVKNVYRDFEMLARKIAERTQ
ncbi:ParA family protein [Brasilonema octagenarum UFV-E1]|uniref:ParA family protein n=2 Tax=Brasilonema TaxID=383614 RepID=A0A856MB78_9CYAN|nr:MULTISPECIES: AAA family ATPase [Brasilonema]NMF65109.1 ParA family protein [Brasilonema octagenarum UFV-OR1]QDL08505.1 ParA family protein [Brasilonema sennae CENA114]QDL14860.1 ParA family protein [Brasilonema octagenarum UFV-E1]